MIINTFHGSLDKSITSFHIATHFGSRKQALSAIGAKYFLDRVESGIPTLYEVIISVEDTFLHKIELDWGKSGVRGALVGIKKVLEKEAPEDAANTALRFNKHFGIINKIANDKEAAAMSEEILLREAEGKLAVLEYPNEVEADGSGYCVLDPSRITLIATTYPDWDEVLEGFKAHSEYCNVKDRVEVFKSTLKTKSA